MPYSKSYNSRVLLYIVCGFSNLGSVIETLFMGLRHCIFLPEKLVRFKPPKKKSIIFFIIYQGIGNIFVFFFFNFTFFRFLTEF